MYKDIIIKRQNLANSLRKREVERKLRSLIIEKGNINSKIESLKILQFYLDKQIESLQKELEEIKIFDELS